MLWSYDSLTKGGLDYPHPVRGRGKYDGNKEVKQVQNSRAELCHYVCGSILFGTAVFKVRYHALTEPSVSVFM